MYVRYLPPQVCPCPVFTVWHDPLLSGLWWLEKSRTCSPPSFRGRFPSFFLWPDHFRLSIKLWWCTWRVLFAPADGSCQQVPHHSLKIGSDMAAPVSPHCQPCTLQSVVLTESRHVLGHQASAVNNCNQVDMCQVVPRLLITRFLEDLTKSHLFPPAKLSLSKRIVS